MPITPPSSDRSNSVAWGSAVIGFEFVAAIGGFAVIGYLIDRWQGTEPVWTLSLTAIGFIGGSYNLFKEVRKIQSRSRSQYRNPSARKDTGNVDPKAASAEVAARRGRPRPTGRVNLFDQEEIDLEELDGVELDWPEEERDRIEDELRQAQKSDPGDSEEGKDAR